LQVEANFHRHLEGGRAGRSPRPPALSTAANHNHNQPKVLAPPLVEQQCG